MERQLRSNVRRPGWGVILTYNASRRRADELLTQVEWNGGKAVALPLDVSEIGTFSAFREAIEGALAANWGRKDFDFLVNNAGYGTYGLIASVTEEQFDGLFGVHLKGPFFLTQILVPLMANGGHIINMSSATTRIATAGVAPYACFKAALEVLTRYQAKEFGGRGIRANSIAPGAIRTELAGGLTDEFEALLAGQTALGRVGEPDEVGSVIASLLSEQNRWVNAQSIEVSGGFII